MRRFGSGRAITPTAILGDNEAVINIAITGMEPSTKIRGLTGHLRELQNMHAHVDNGTVQPIFTTSEDNLVDPLTKLGCTNGGHWDGLEGLLSAPPIMERLRKEVHLQFDKKHRGG